MIDQDIGSAGSDIHQDRAKFSLVFGKQCGSGGNRGEYQIADVEIVLWFIAFKKEPFAMLIDL